MVGGVFGGVWNGFNKSITKWRMRHMSSNFLKVAEVAVWSMILTTVAYATMCVSSDCHPYGLGRFVDKYPVQFSCEDGSYHALGALCKSFLHLSFNFH